MQVIGVAAQLAQGKDVFCDYLVTRLNSWERSAFANAVKEVYQSSFGVTRDFVEQWKRNPDPPPGMLMNIRKGLQFIGDGFRKIKDEIWIEIALRDESQKLIISDSRYINEAKAVAAKGGTMFVLYRPGFLNDDPNPSESQIKPIIEFCIKHLEEGQIPSFYYLKSRYGDECPDAMQYYNYYLVNDGTLEDLYIKIDEKIVPYIKSKHAD